MTFWSCVEKMKVVPCVRFSSLMRSRMCWPVTESRLAVGSSASTSCGRVTRVRVIAQAHPLQQLVDAALALVPRDRPHQQQRQLAVLEHRQHGDQVEALED